MLKIEDIAKQASDHYLSFLLRKNKVVYRRAKKIYGSRGSYQNNEKALRNFHRRIEKANGGSKWRRVRRQGKALSYAFNTLCSRQDDFGNALFPTIDIPLESVGQNTALP